MEEENGGTEVVRIRSVRVLQRDSARFRPLSPLLSSPRLASPLHVSSQRRHRSSSHPSYPRLIDAGLENQDGRPITLSISRSPVYLPGNILPKNKYLRQAGPGQGKAPTPFDSSPPRRRCPRVGSSYIYAEATSSLGRKRGGEEEI